MLNYRNKDTTLSLLESEMKAMSRQEWFPKGAVRSSKIEVYDVRENSSYISTLKSTILTAITRMYCLCY